MAGRLTRVRRRSTKGFALRVPMSRPASRRADYVKVLGGTRPAVLALLEESKKQGLFVAGHITPGVGPTESAMLGW